jgi:hypothetical protein
VLCAFSAGAGENRRASLDWTAEGGCPHVISGMGRNLLSLNVGKTADSSSLRSSE